MIEKLKDFGYNLVNDNQTKALVASVVVNAVLLVCVLSMLITGNVPGHSKDDADTTESTTITECTLEHVSSTTSTTTEESTTATAGKTTVRNQGGNNNNTTKATTKATTKTTTKATTTTTTNRDNDGEWVEGWY